MVLTTMAIGAALGAVGGLVAFKDKDMPVWEKALIGAGIGATGGVAGHLMKDMLDGMGTKVVKQVGNSLPAGGNPVSFTGYYAGRTEKQWLQQAEQFAKMEAETGVNYSGNIKNCVRYAGEAAGKKKGA